MQSRGNLIWCLELQVFSRRCYSPSSQKFFVDHHTRRTASICTHTFVCCYSVCVNVFVEIFVLLCMFAHEESSWRDFQFILKLKLSSLTLDFEWFLRSNLIKIFKLSFRTLLVKLLKCNLNTHEEAAFMGHKSGETLHWRQFWLIVQAYKMEIKYLAQFRKKAKVGWIILQSGRVWKTTRIRWCFGHSARKTAKKERQMWLKSWFYA